MKLKPSILASVGLAVVAAITGFYATGYWQTLLINIATTFLGLGIGLIVINHFLSQHEKRAAAIPMLEMIQPSISELHNDHFIVPCRLKFGIPGFSALIAAYQENGRNPEALSPEQRNGLYEVIKEHRSKALPLMDSIHDQLREMTSLLGWSFSPRIVTVSLRVRLTIVNFKNLDFDDSDKTKLRACELYLNTDGSCAGVMREITGLLGLSEDDWTTSSRA